MGALLPSSPLLGHGGRGQVPLRKPLAVFYNLPLAGVPALLLLGPIRTGGGNKGPTAAVTRY